MRSRYSAFVMGEIDYLKQSIHPDHRADFDPDAVRDWAKNSEWLGLKIINCSGGDKDDNEGTVEFMALFREKGNTYQHHEIGQFSRMNGVWYYVDGEVVTPDSGSE